MNDSAPVRETQVISIGLLAALVSPELESFSSALLAGGWKQVKVEPRLSVAQIERWEKVVADCTVAIHTGVIGKPGQAHAAIETFAFLERAKPSIVFLCGIAGSLDKENIKKKDVVVGKHVYWKGEDRKKDGNPCFEYRPVDHKPPNFDADIMNRLEMSVSRLNAAGELSNGAFGVHVGEIFSWDYVTNGPMVTASILANHDKAVCVEMEAGGFLSALARYKKINSDRPMAGFVVRGISDYTEQKDKDKETRKLASRNAAAVCAKLAEDAFDPSGSNLMAQLMPVAVASVSL